MKAIQTELEKAIVAGHNVKSLSTANQIAPKARCKRSMENDLCFTSKKETVETTNSCVHSSSVAFKFYLSHNKKRHQSLQPCCIWSLLCNLTVFDAACWKEFMISYAS